MKNMNTKNQTPVILHGEAMIFPSKLPETVKAIKPSNQDYHIIADSESTGNHHVIDCPEGVEFFQDDNGTMFMKNSVPTQVRCVIQERHTAIPLTPGTWEFGIQKEYDHLSQHLRNVRD